MPKLTPDTCPVCGDGQLREVLGEFRTQVEGPKAIPTTLTVPNLTWRHCDSCGEDLLGDQASLAITAAHRKALGLLTVEEIRSIRQMLGKTQLQMSDLLGIGEKTYCRWESGTHFQSEAFDRYLRVMRAAPEVAEVLNEIRREKEGTNEPSSGTFTYLQDISMYEATSERFTELLQVGPFQVQFA